MGVAELVDTFNTIASPRFSCEKATLGYEFAHDLEWQVLTFHGRDAGGSEFSAVEKLRGGADPVSGARAAAEKLLAKKELSHERLLALPAPAGDPPVDAGPADSDGPTG